MTVEPRTRSRLISIVENLGLWVVGHASRVWPFVAVALVVGFTWETVRQIHPRDFSTALHALDRRWLWLAAAITTTNIAAMGLYDVVAFRQTRSRWSDRWRYGAVCFAWSNFLTLGPLAGPAMRFWLYRPAVDHLSDLHGGVVSVAVAFTSGLAGWTAAALLASQLRVPPGAAIGLAFVFALLIVVAAQTVIRWRTAGMRSAPAWQAPVLALIGWSDWLLACAAFIACMRATGSTAGWSGLGETFFTGQVIGVLSLVPGGFGSSDAFWVSQLPLTESTAAAVLMAYRVIYYILPWAAASLLLLSWVTRRMTTRIEMARRVVASLVGGGGLLILLSAASPALYARLPMLERFVPLPLVEAGHFAAAMAGLLLLVLARGLARGYRAAFRLTLVLLTVAACGAILKGFDWEEAVVLGVLFVGTWTQAALFDRPSHGDWIEGPDVRLAATALTLFVLFGLVSHRVGPSTMERLSHIGYRVQAPRFLRTAGSMLLAVSAGAVYLLLRAPVRFRKPGAQEMRTVLDLHARLGGGTNPLMVAVGDKSAFVDGDRGFCLYRTIGPYVVVFSDPVVRSAPERTAFLDAFFAFAGELDRRPVFYQISLDWIPVLHDRGYDFFKLGEEGHVLLDRVTLDGHAGKLYRQILRRGERDGATFRILAPADVPAHLDELEAISSEWLRTKGLAERQFSIGYFDREYLARFPCAIVEETAEPRRILAFANLLEGPQQGELSVDLMRHRSDGPKVMDFLFVSLFLHGKSQGYARFNLGMAPLASVGDQRGAHLRERLARVLFQRGEQWYNFQGLRAYKDKFDPEWMPRYMAYQDAWEWPVAIAYVSALIAGGWGSILTPPVDDAPAVHDPLGRAEPARA
ncbi:MAG: bifunctional lysylphosphatidylglycerol flippase/synthetase MprF [Vicinamibacterales bacterium]